MTPIWLWIPKRQSRQLMRMEQMVHRKNRLQNVMAQCNDLASKSFKKALCMPPVLHDERSDTPSDSREEAWFHEFSMVQQVCVIREVPMQRSGKLQMFCNNSTPNIIYNMDTIFGSRVDLLTMFHAGRLAVGLKATVTSPCPAGNPRDEVTRCPGSCWAFHLKGCPARDEKHRDFDSMKMIWKL